LLFETGDALHYAHGEQGRSNAQNLGYDIGAGGILQLERGGGAVGQPDGGIVSQPVQNEDYSLDTEQHMRLHPPEGHQLRLPPHFFHDGIGPEHV
jgi:hypothetical protein